MNVEHSGSLIVVKRGGSLQAALGRAFDPARDIPRDMAHCLLQLTSRPQRVAAAPAKAELSLWCGENAQM